MIRQAFFLSREDFEDIQALLDTAIAKIKILEKSHFDRASCTYEGHQIHNLLKRIKNYLQEEQL